ncbi:uncharacterized protein LOC113462884 [Phoenix dactylifera]|uniref:Uncharacterized protein LOC113462884 n=1 Tax=Phoenix dactylifera TaxID=42345 RepID=A0A8B9AII2_PHODC|nr:uncharacterized protein LOC113462884 [Phoenix dactylifera]
MNQGLGFLFMAKTLPPPQKYFRGTTNHGNAASLHSATYLPPRPSPLLFKDDKGKKPKPFAPPPPPPPPHLRRLHPRSVGGIAFVAVVLRRPRRTVAVFRCGRAEDTLGTLGTMSLSGDKDGVVARPKLLEFVGVRPASPRRSPSRAPEYLVSFPSGGLGKVCATPWRG